MWVAVKRPSLPWLWPIRTGFMDGDVSLLCSHWIHCWLLHGLHDILHSDWVASRLLSSDEIRSVEVRLDEVISDMNPPSLTGMLTSVSCSLLITWAICWLLRKTCAWWLWTINWRNPKMAFHSTAESDWDSMLLLGLQEILLKCKMIYDDDTWKYRVIGR